MIRKLSLFVFVTALIVSACGRQVTPNRPDSGAGGVPGYMTVNFTVQAPFNFANYRYVIVFNTSGDGNTPHGNVFQTNYQGYSFALLAGSGVQGTAGVQAVQYIRQAGSNAPLLANLNPSPIQLRFNPNSNGIGTQFQITFDRALFYGYVTPSPGPGGTATPSPSPSPTATPTGGGSPSPSPSAAPYPTTQAQINWKINCFVYQPSAGPTAGALSSLGLTGTDTSFQSPQLNTTQAFDSTITAIAGQPPSDPAAQITSAEFVNNP